MLLLRTLLLQLAEGEDHVHCGPAGSEAALRLRVDTRSEARQGDSCKHFADHVQEGNAPVVVTITAVALVRSCTVSLCWRLACLGECGPAPSTDRGDHGEVVGQWLSRVSELQAGCRLSQVPCRKRGSRWLC